MNPFEAVAERQVAAPLKRQAARMEAKTALRNSDAPMVGTLQEREQARQSAQFRWYKVYLRQKRDELLAGPFGEQATSLSAFLKQMSIEEAPSLLHLVEQANWNVAPRKVRQEVLSWCATAISDLRIVNGLAPFDDSLMGEPPTGFEQLRALLQPDRHDQ